MGHGLSPKLVLVLPVHPIKVLCWGLFAFLLPFLRLVVPVPEAFQPLRFEPLIIIEVVDLLTWVG